MFTSHPSLAAHFEPPTFSPGIPQRELRGRLKLLEHANRAGLIPEVEWKLICKAVQEQTAGDDDINIKSDDNQEENLGSKISEMRIKATEAQEEGAKHRVIDPFRYLAVETRIEPNEDDANNNTSSTSPAEKKAKKKKHWLEYQTTSLIPISPHRRGSAEDIALPYSMELWRKAKGLNRDRSVLACTMAHLMAMKTLVGGGISNGDTLDGTGDDEHNGGFDLILEDNVRAFVNLGEGGCECANRIWDTIEASKSSASDCHMRYYGWLGSSPNMAWVYKNHLSRSTLNPLQKDNAARKCAIFPFPTSDDFELDSISAASKSKNQDEKPNSQPDQTLEAKSFSTPQFTTPGGTAVWGTFAYTVSPAAYRRLIHHLQNDVGSLMWKGKRMRAFQAKPIDKVLPRIVKDEFSPKSIHLSNKVAFVRAPMLGSLLHPQWEEGFCSSTELQYRLASIGDDNGSDVWDRVWLTNEERQIVKHRQKSGKWVRKGDISSNSSLKGTSMSSSHSSRGNGSSAIATQTILLATIAISCLTFLGHPVVPFLSRYVVADAFVFNAPCHNAHKQPNVLLMSSGVSESKRKKAKLGKVPIISRKIPIEINGPVDSKKDGVEERNESIESDNKMLDVTIWEMDKPSDLIQEWWSIDESERSVRVGDPFGVVMWPGSILASKELMKQHYFSSPISPLTNSTVLVLGAGTGVEAQTAALLGAKSVIATDINPLTLKLLEYGAKVDDRIGDSFEAKFFDLFSDKPLPACDILIAADVLYNSDLAKQVGQRLHEAIVRSFEEGNPPTKVIVTDSQKFHGTNFLEEVDDLKELNMLFQENDWEQLKWEKQKLEKVCGSGVLVDEDQIYDVETRMLCWGW